MGTSNKYGEKSLGKNKIGIVGWYGYKNTGDEAILDSLIRMVNNAVPEAEVIVFSANPRLTYRSHMVKSVPLGTGFGVHKWFRNPRNLSDISCHIKVLRQCDLLIIGGGGLINDMGSWASYLSGTKTSESKILLARMLGKKVVVIGVGVRRFRRRFAKAFTAATLNSVNAITVRDRWSSKNLQECGVKPSKIKVTVDPSIELSPANEETVNRILEKEEIPMAKDKIGISLRWNPVRDGRWTRFDTVHISFLRRMGRIVDFLIENFNSNVVFIPMCYPPTSTNDVEIIDCILKRVNNKSSAFVVKGEYNPKEVLGLIGKMDLMLGMRLHSVIFSAITRTPVVGIIYAQKVQQFLERLDLLEYSFSDIEEDVEQIKNKIMKAWRDRSVIKRKLGENFQRLKNLNRENSRVIKCIYERA